MDFRTFFFLLAAALIVGDGYFKGQSNQNELSRVSSHSFNMKHFDLEHFCYEILNQGLLWNLKNPQLGFDQIGYKLLKFEASFYIVFFFFPLFACLILLASLIQTVWKHYTDLVSKLNKDVSEIEEWNKIVTQQEQFHRESVEMLEHKWRCYEQKYRKELQERKQSCEMVELFEMEYDRVAEELNEIKFQELLQGMEGTNSKEILISS